MKRVTDRERILKALQRVIDPELGVDIVALGLVYGVHVDGPRVFIRMTMTTPFCPLEGEFRKAVTAAVQGVPGIESVTIDFTFEPAWTPAKIRAGVREQLGRHEELTE